MDSLKPAHGTDDLMADSLFCDWQNKERTLGMRFKSGEVSVSKQDIKRFAAEFDLHWVGRAFVCGVPSD
jgi:hypothetical protein